MQISRAAVVGLGTMGAGIAEVLARAGLEVRAVEIDERLLGIGRTRIETSLEKAVTRGRLEVEDRDAILGRLHWTTSRRDLIDVDLVVEAVPERLEFKTSLFTELHDICPPTTIFATNTSSLPVTAIAAASGRPERVIGMHFFNPAPVMRLVEVVSTVLTAPEVTASIVDLANTAGKTPVAVGDRAGFVANTLLFGYLGQAARMVDEGHVSVADIDAAMVASCGLPMGPMRLLDLVGLDVAVEVLRVLDEEWHDPRHRIAPLLRRLVMAGRLGDKTKRGFYPLAESADAPASTLASTPESITVVGEHVEEICAALGVANSPDASTPDVIVVGLGSDPDLLRREAATSSDATKVIGVHLPRAPRTAPVVELVITPKTSAETIDLARAQAAAAGRTPVVCKARPGYVVEALLYGQLDDSARMVDAGYATTADVDAAMTLGCGYPAGPFAMLAEVGAAVVAAGLADPSPLLLDLAVLG